jgi:hypothetical protein
VYTPTVNTRVKLRLTALAGYLATNTGYGEVSIRQLTAQGNPGVTGATGATGATGLTAVVSGVVNAGTFVTMDNLKFTVTSSGNRGLSVATVSGTAALYTSGSYSGATVGHNGGASGDTVTYITTPSSSLFSWSFPVAGDWSQYVFVDPVNVKMYRVNLFIGSSYNNNFISVERVVG